MTFRPGISGQAQCSQDGIIHMSRYMPARKSVALFDRCSAAVAVGDATPLLEHREFASVAEICALAIDRG